MASNPPQEQNITGLKPARVQGFLGQKFGPQLSD
jgi:hypothetical protein